VSRRYLSLVPRKLLLVGLAVYMTATNRHSWVSGFAAGCVTLDIVLSVVGSVMLSDRSSA
jgi:cell shape-determining protein MreD